MIYGKYVDEDGDQYYCPINAVADKQIVSEWELENCLEAATTERYAGSINMATRDWHSTVS